MATSRSDHPTGTVEAADTARNRDIQQIVTAAQELFAERGPSRVTLRQVAARAGVNYGLIHQYIGTKDQLLALAFRSASSGQAEQFTQSSDFDEAVSWMMRPKSASYVRMLAHSILEDRDPGQLMGRSPAMQELSRRLGEDGPGLSDDLGDDPRVQVAALTCMVLGWRLFGQFLSDITGIEGVAEDEVTTAVFALAREGVGARHRTSAVDGHQATDPPSMTNSAPVQ